MADFRPFRALRYRSGVAGDIGDVLAPPYDVIDAPQQAALHQRSPYNVIRLELGEQRPDDSDRSNRYTRAAAALADWRERNVLTRDERPSFYVYVQEFEHEGTRRRRTSLLGRLRLEPWDAGVGRPPAGPKSRPKEDRLQLLRHLRTNVSPVLALYRDPTKRIENALGGGTPLVDATTADGQRHTLLALTNDEAIGIITSELNESPLYILDGHHRYETALAYREERRSQAATWSGDEPENFMLAAITSVDDPGLMLLPIHRLVRPPSVPADVIAQLGRFFRVEDTTPKSYDGTALLRLLARVSAAGDNGTAFGALGLDEGRLHLLTLTDAPAVRALMPERSQVWQSLDVSVLEYAVLHATLGVEPGASDEIEYTEDASLALREVEGGRWPLAFLLNATRVAQILSVADAGERMPAKSTFFYPKLATGLVLNALE